MRKPSRHLRAFAAFLVFALIHTTWGPQSWAQVVVVPVGSVSTPLGGGAAASIAGTPSSAGSLAAPNLSQPAAGLTGTLFASPGAPVLERGGAQSLAENSPIQPINPSARAEMPTATPVALTPTDLPSEPTPAVAPESASKTVDETRFESGPRTSAVATRIRAIASGVKRAFTRRSAATLPLAPDAIAAAPIAVGHIANLQPAQNETSQTQTLNEPPSPPKVSDKNGRAKRKAWLGLGAVVAGLIGGKLVMQVGLEAQGVSMSKLTEDAFGDFSILAQVTIFAMIGSMIGQPLAQFFTEKFGLTKTFYAGHILRAASLGTMVLLLGTGLMPLPLMFMFYVLNGLMNGIAANTEGTLTNLLLRHQGVSQEKYRTWWSLSAQIVAVITPILLAVKVSTWGAGWVTALYPATILTALMLFLMLKIFPLGAARRIESEFFNVAPNKTQAMTAPEVSGWKKIMNAFKQIFTNMEAGKKFVLGTPVLKYSLFGAMIFDLMNMLIYRLIAPGYGKIIAGSEGMASIQGNIVGMFSLGGFMLGLVFIFLQRQTGIRDKNKNKNELEARNHQSLLRWMKGGLSALALLGTMALPLSIPLASTAFLDTWAPGTILALALIPFGFLHAGATIKLSSYFNEKISANPSEVQKALAFSSSALTALAILLLLSLKPLFGDLTSFNPFPWMAAALVPVGAVLFHLYRQLKSALKSEVVKNITESPAQSTSGGYVGFLVGIVAATLVLSALPFIPGLGGLFAGLGVLGKFAVHAVAALALPAIGYLTDRALRRKL